MSRSLKKGPYIDERIIKKLGRVSSGTKEVIKIWNRAAVITPEMIDYTFGVHNGKEHIPVRITEEMVGHRLGEFAPTRKFVKHGGRMAREEEASMRAVEAGKSKTIERETGESKPTQE